MNREELYRIWKTEKNEKALQKLAVSFYSDVSTMLSDSKGVSSVTGQDPTQVSISKKEFGVIRRLTREIAETRMRKIIEAALSRQDLPTEMLAEEEVEFAKQVAIHIGDRYRFIDELAERSVVLEEKPTEPVEARLEVVRFLSDFPAIIGVDLRTYGPFKAEDVATLPAENASVLISQGVVKQVRFSQGIVSTP
jgi:DNA replication factor GINS